VRFVILPVDLELFLCNAGQYSTNVFSKATAFPSERMENGSRFSFYRDNVPPAVSVSPDGGLEERESLSKPVWISKLVKIPPLRDI
jgi:hypothetical protein